MRSPGWSGSARSGTSGSRGCASTLPVRERCRAKPATVARAGILTLAERRLLDLDALRWLLGRVAELPDLLDDVEAARHLAEQGVLGRQLCVGGGDDEELAACGAGRLVAPLCHRDDALLV